MKNIYLIGDSIRYGSKNSKGYECFLKEKLNGNANIYSPVKIAVLLNIH